MDLQKSPLLNDATRGVRVTLSLRLQGDRIGQSWPSLAPSYPRCALFCFQAHPLHSAKAANNRRVILPNQPIVEAKTIVSLYGHSERLRIRKHPLNPAHNSPSHSLLDYPGLRWLSPRFDGGSVKRSSPRWERSIDRQRRSLCPSRGVKRRVYFSSLWPWHYRAHFIAFKGIDARDEPRDAELSSISSGVIRAKLNPPGFLGFICQFESMFDS